jgi:hypothetical protein
VKNKLSAQNTKIRIFRAEARSGLNIVQKFSFLHIADTVRSDKPKAGEKQAVGPKYQNLDFSGRG